MIIALFVTLSFSLKAIHQSIHPTLLAFAIFALVLVAGAGWIITIKHVHAFLSNAISFIDPHDFNSSLIHSFLPGLLAPASTSCAGHNRISNLCMFSDFTGQVSQPYCHNCLLASFICYEGTLREAPLGVNSQLHELCRLSGCSQLHHQLQQYCPNSCNRTFQQLQSGFL